MQSCILLFALFSLLDAAGDLARTEATGADIHLARRTVNQHMHALHIRRPGALRLTVGMTHQIAGHGALFAYFAIFTHSVTPPCHAIPLTIKIKQTYSTI